MAMPYSRAGAEASNAGDYFHLLWACKRIISMLQPKSTLTAVCVEGPTWEDSILTDDKGALLAIDLSEYYNGETYEGATKVVFSQLKYSTYQAAEPWTASKLCSSSNKARNNSIIRRLADTYKDYAERYLDVQEKLVLKLVSNRSLNAEFKKTMADVKTLITEVTIKRFCDLDKRLVGASQKAMLESIRKTTNLGSSDFIGFLKVIDFEDCGSDISSIQRIEILKELGCFGIKDLHNAFLALKDDIYNLMLPAAKKYSWTRGNVLAALSTTDQMMFPAPNRIEILSDVFIERSVLRTLVEQISCQTKICIHAGGGIGKTTLVSKVNEYLSDASVVLLYDCFGGGSFFQPSERRHLPKVAFKQICNELAVECGTNLMLEDRSESFEYLRFLKRQLEAAVKYVKAQNPNAAVVLMIDAADNAVTAANKYGQECFLPLLLEENLPEGVVLVVTARTEHLRILSLPDSIKKIEILPFELDETKEMIRSKYPNAADDICEEFHLLTDRNPRLQRYFLSSTLSLEDALEWLRPNGETLNSLFDENLYGIHEQYRSIFDTNVLFASLIILPPPIPLNLLCSICAISEDALYSISSDSQKAICVFEQHIYLRDEDFATYLANKYADLASAANQIANFLFNNRVNNSYCARHVHLLLNKTNRFDDLVMVSFDSIEDTTLPIDQANQVMIDRLKTALQRAEMRLETNSVLSCKLLYKLIDYSKSDDAVFELLRKAPIETALFCDEYSTYNAYNKSGASFDAISKAALSFSLLPDQETRANQLIDSYDNHVSNYFALESEERSLHDRPSLDNIINISHAMLLSGRNAVEWISRWKPLAYQTDIIRGLIIRLLPGDIDGYCNIIVHNEWNEAIKLAISAAFISFQLDPPAGYVEMLVQYLESFSETLDESISKDDVLTLLEYMLTLGYSETLVVNIAEKLKINYRFSRLPALFEKHEKNEFIAAMRYYVLKQTCQQNPLDANAFTLPKSKDETILKDERQAENNQQEIKHAANTLLPMVEFRLKNIRGIENDEFDARYNELVTHLDRSTLSLHPLDYRNIAELELQLLVEAVLCNQKLGNLQLKEKLSPVVRKKSYSPNFKVTLLDKTILNPNASLFAHDLLSWIDECYQQSPGAAEEMSDIFVECAKLMRRSNYDEARKLFQRAIVCTREADYESYRKLHLFEKLSKSATEDMPTLSYQVTRVAEDYFYKIGDSKNFPYKESIVAGTLLSEKTIWSTLCRLDDRHDEFYIFKLVDTLSIVLSTLLSVKKLAPALAVALLGMLTPDQSHDYWDIVELILDDSSISSPQLKLIIELLIHDALYDLPLGDKEYTCERLMNYLDQNYIPNGLNVKELRGMTTFWKSLPKQDELLHAEKRELKTKQELRKMVEDSPICSVQDFVLVVEKLHPSEYEGYLNLLIETIAPDVYCDVLEMILTATLNRGSIPKMGEMLVAFNGIIERVALSPNVKNWRYNKTVQKKHLNRFLDSSLYLFNHAHDHEVFCSIFPFDSDDLRIWIVEYIIRNEKLFNEQLVVALMHISDTLTIDERIDFLTWSLNEEMQRIHPATGDTPPQLIETSENIEDYIAIYIWRTLGHPDKHIRWKAAHVLLRLNHLGNKHILLFIQQHLYFHSFPSSYMDSNNYFFSESAQLWYLLTCLRIVKDNPEALQSTYPFFESIACSRRIINALQRKVAKDICLLLLPIDAVDKRAELLEYNQCISGTSNSIPRYAREDAMENPEPKFHFDTMDTLPYWYDSLAGIFSSTQRGIARICDPYIEQFEITNHKVREWHERYLSRNNYDRTRNRHGSIPSYETLDKYAEWHAMFYTADELRKSTPVVEDDCTYDGWLNSFYPGYHGFWLSEFLGNAPCHPFFWQFTRIPNPQNKKIYYIPDDLPFSLVLDNEYITLNLDYSSTFDNSHQRISIESVFIENKDLEALLYALKKPRTYLDHFYRNEYFEEKEKVAVDPSVITIDGPADTNLDNCDLLSKDVAYYNSQIFDLSPILKAYISEPLYNVIVGAANTCADLRLFRWNMSTQENVYDEKSTAGHMIVVKQNKLQHILTALECSLIFEVRITFEDKSYRFYGTPWAPSKIRRLYILQHDGFRIFPN